MATQVKDITKMSAAEIEVYLAERKAEERKQALEKGEQARRELADYCQSKYGLSLKALGLSYKQPSKLAGTYKHPESGELFTYSGFGKVPAWLKGADKKPRQDYRHLAN